MSRSGEVEGDLGVEGVGEPGADRELRDRLSPLLDREYILMPLSSGMP